MNLVNADQIFMHILIFSAVIDVDTIPFLEAQIPLFYANLGLLSYSFPVLAYCGLRSAPIVVF